MSKERHPKQPAWFDRFLNGVEAVGNRLPHPITLFFLFCLATVLLSALCAALGVSVTATLLNRATNTLEVQTVSAVSLLSREGILFMLTRAVSNFTSFAPLGVVLVAMLGVGVAEGSGYLPALLKKAVQITPRRLLTPAVVFLGVMSNVASDAGYVVLIPLGALMFQACGRHPLAGLAAAFAGVSGGFSASLVIGSTDPLLAGITQEAVRLIDGSYVVHPTANWYFLFVSTFVITLAGSLVTDRVVEPRLGPCTPPDNSAPGTGFALSPREELALKWANRTLLLYVLAVAAAAAWPGSLLRNPETGSLVAGAPFMDGIIVLIALMFFLPAVVYGVSSGSLPTERALADQLGRAMSSMGGYIALAFLAAQFVKYFEFSNLGTILAVAGAGALEHTGLGPIPLMLLFILLSAFLNLFIGSASAKWAILAPVFVPMLMLLGASPELIQAAYRIGDSATNLITPMMSYFAMIVAFAQKYDKRAGIGTLISTMLPYSLLFLLSWTVLLVLWMALGLPVGPGAGLVYPPG